MDVIGDDIKKALKDAGYESEVDLILHPAWTTDWITPRGRKALEDYGIAAPLEADADKDVLLNGKRIVKCTNCGSQNTRLVSQFGSTACKAQFQCDDCQEPFDYFKCLK
jgi:ring-1,2-phenylacetyl-CoA epoxidase subunit PaaD